MSNLIKSTAFNLPKEVSNLSKVVYQANSSVIIKNIDDMNIVVNSIHQSVNKALADKGVNMDVKDMNHLKISITDDILKDFSVLSLQDISLCFSMGVRGNLGEYFGVNVVSLYGWLKKYKEEILPKMFSEVKNHLPPAQEVEQVVDYKALDLEKVDNICHAIEMYIKDGVYEFNDYGNIHYNFLNRLGKFDDISDSEKDLVKEDARLLFIRDVKNKNLSLIGQGKNFQLTDVRSLLEKIEEGEKDIETLIDISYKKLLLKIYVINLKITIKDLDKFKEELILKIEQHYGK
jgi:hypothetical protein